MPAPIRRHQFLHRAAAVALLTVSGVVTVSALAQAADTPRRGGVLPAVIAAEPPSLDPHQEVVHWAKMRNYVAPPNYYSNQKLQDVWLAED